MRTTSCARPPARFARRSASPATSTAVHLRALASERSTCGLNPDRHEASTPLARYSLPCLNRQGRGTGVEIHPLDPSAVARPHRCVVEFRTINLRHGELIVVAWAAEDDHAFDDAWIDKLVDLGSQWGQCDVTSIGFAAPETADRDSGSCRDRARARMRTGARLSCRSTAAARR